VRRKRALGALLLIMTAGALAPTAQADAAYEIRPQHTDMCLDVPHSIYENGVALIQWPCNQQPNQQFELRYVGSDNDGKPYYKILIGGKCLDVAGANTSDGTKVQLYTCLDVRNQEFVLRYDGTYGSPGYPYYNLLPRHSYKCVSIGRGLTLQGARVEQWGCVGGAHQRFRLAWR
jgi:hypothetical protein